MDVISILNTIIENLSVVIIAILNLLPNSPFTWDLGALSTYVGVMNYFIPFRAMATIMMAYVAAVTVWYTVRWVLRFAKYIQ
ncbi:MAG: hypothetical protein C4589_10085 [Peptococcaceae bacterium]|nr:MAG: hypothetical protein C4589_10085 [Peptococcaceae bacterium]